MADVMRGIEKAEERLNESLATAFSLESERFTKDEYSGWRMVWPPWRSMLITGLPGLLLIGGQFLLGWMYEERMVGGYWVGYARMLMSVFGAILLIVSGPQFRPKDWTEEKQAELDSAREHFRRKRL